MVNRELRAIHVAIACSLTGVFAKSIVGTMTHSMSMLSSAIDSLGDLFVSVVNLFVVRLAAKGPDDDHNYGHAKIEGLGAMFEGGFIFAAASFIVYEAVHKIVVGEKSHDSVMGIVVMVPILLVTIATVTYLRKVAKETGSIVIRADATHYMMDVYVNLGVLFALVLVKLTGEPIIDSIVSVAIALYMFRAAAGIVKDGFDIVMDKSLAPDVVERLQATLAACTAIDSWHDFKTRLGRVPFVDFHIVVRPELTAREVHEIFLAFQRDMRAIAGPTTKVLMHTDIAAPAPSTASL